MKIAITKDQLRIEYMQGTGPGGQHRNRTYSACRITHIPTGITAYADERSQHTSRRMAMRELERRLRDRKREQRAAAKKARRDQAIRDGQTVRTYDLKRNVVKDHRTGKVASVKNILIKGLLDLLK